VDRRLAQWRNLTASCLLHGADDPVVPGAPAQVAGEGEPDLVLARVGVAIEQGLGRDQHPGRAEPALDAALLEELALERVQLLAFLEAL